MEKKWRMTHCKSVWIHVSIHFTWSTNNLGLLLSCCTIEAIILKRKLVKDWMGNPLSPRLGEVLKGTTKDTLQLTDVLTGEAESLPICGAKTDLQILSHSCEDIEQFFFVSWNSKSPDEWRSTSLFVCVCLSIHIDLDVHVFVSWLLSISWNVIISWILKQERLACQAWNCRQ